MAIGAREIDLDPIAHDRQLGFNADRLLPDAVVVDHCLAVIFTIRHGPDGASDAALRIIQHFQHGSIDHIRAELAAELADSLRPDGVRGELRVQIANGRLRHTHVGGDEAL